MVWQCFSFDGNPGTTSPSDAKSLGRWLSQSENIMKPLTSISKTKPAYRLSSLSSSAEQSSEKGLPRHDAILISFLVKTKTKKQKKAEIEVICCITKSLWTAARLPTNCRVTAAAALCDYKTQKKQILFLLKDELVTNRAAPRTGLASPHRLVILANWD